MSAQDGWHRLHPLSPAVRAGRVLVAFIVVFLPTFLGGSRSGWDAVIHGLVLAALIGLGIVSWLVTRWRVEGSNLRIETGLIRRSSMRYPLTQVQAIDTVRPGLARVFGLAELRLRMGGTGGSARLAYLPVAQADTLRARLLALGTGSHEDTPEPEDEVLVTVPVGRSLAALLLTLPALVLIAYLAALITAVATGSSATRAIAGYAAPVIIGDAVALWQRFNRSYRATVAQAPEGLRVRAGLVETSAETIPRGRVQAVRLLEPILWRPFGWCRLDVDVAGRVRDRGGERRNERQLRAVLPVGSRAEAQRLIDLLVPGAPPSGNKPPRRARWKSPLRYRRLSFGFDARYAVATSGRLARVQRWVPLTKVQSLRRLEGPAQRRLGLATIYIDTAGKRFGAAFRDLDGEGSFRELERLTDLARAARRA
ncbi:MAG TPA: PH domain-containing protein [Gaiellaceae bacterium]|nr:PH domain-containing protein [Gaiellaceae bacterium]